MTALQEQQRRSWLYRTIKNLYVDRIRYASKETIVDEFTQQQQYSEEIVLLEWDQLLETLPDSEGVIFSLRYLQGYNSNQIGEILSIPPGTVRFKLSSARQHLKEFLGGQKMFNKKNYLLNCNVYELNLLEFLENEPNASIIEITKRLNFSRALLNKTILSLTNKGFLVRKRIGRTTRWIVKI
mgnify:CR=1 FL=1